MSDKNKICSETSPITKNYLEKIEPYEIIVESIALQNREIY